MHKGPKLMRVAGASLLALCAAVLGNANPTAETTDVLLFRSAKLLSVEEKSLERKGAFALAATPRELVEGSARIVVSVYQCKFVRFSARGDARPIAADVNCYEVRAGGEELWAMWSWGGSHLVHFRLVDGGEGSSYIAWSEGQEARFVRLKRRRDPVEALGSFLAGGEGETKRIPVLKLVPEGRWGVSAFFFDILVESIVESPDGKTTVQVMEGESRQLHTLIFDGQKWRRED